MSYKWFLMTTGLVVSSSVFSSEEIDFNYYIIKAINEIYPKYKMGGYNINRYYIHDIEYNNDLLKGNNSINSPPSETMCVATMLEVITTAIEIYSKETGDKKVFSKETGAPIQFWQGVKKTNIKPYIYVMDGVRSTGTGYALEKFGMGRQIKFEYLKEGDFINFSRTTESGHAVDFLGYLDKNGKILKNYSDKVVGFKYFSAQGKGKYDAGLGFRNAYFSGNCNSSTDSVLNDCKIFRNAYLYSGRMYSPQNWKINAAITNIQYEILESNKIFSKPVAKTNLSKEYIDNKKLQKQLSSDGYTKNNGVISIPLNKELQKQQSFDKYARINGDVTRTLNKEYPAINSNVLEYIQNNDKILNKTKVILNTYDDSKGSGVNDISRDILSNNDELINAVKNFNEELNLDFPEVVNRKYDGVTEDSD